MAADLAKIAKDRKIKYFLISYVDLFGGLRAKLVPCGELSLRLLFSQVISDPAVVGPPTCERTLAK